jgi:hypothetical protein
MSEATSELLRPGNVCPRIGVISAAEIALPVSERSPVADSGSRPIDRQAIFPGILHVVRDRTAVPRCVLSPDRGDGGARIGFARTGMAGGIGARRSELDGGSGHTIDMTVRGVVALARAGDEKDGLLRAGRMRDAGTADCGPRAVSLGDARLRLGGIEAGKAGKTSSHHKDGAQHERLRWG